jgi:uncharacterized protein (TIGR00369 family)
MKNTSTQLPWTKSCFVCGEDNPHGLHLRTRLENDKAVLDYTTREADAGYKRITHGGIGMTLLDEVMTWAAIAAMKKVCVAVELTVRLKQPIEVGQKIRVEGWVTKGTSRLSRTEAQILDEEGLVLMSAEGKYMPMSGDKANLCEKDFVTGPDTIDPHELLGEIR